MTFTITKSFHPINEKIINSTSTITNVVADGNDIIISSMDNKYPLARYQTKVNKKGIIKLGDCAVIKELSSTNVKFIGTVDNNDEKNEKNEKIICVVPKHQFQLITIKDAKNITINNNPNIRHHIVETILNSNPDLCKCHECYHLVGFITLCEFNIVVQLICEHKSTARAIIIMKSTLDKKKLVLYNTSVLSVIDFFTLCNSNNFHEKVSAKSIITSVTSNNCDKIYFLSSYGKKGHVWVVPFFSGLNFVGTAGLMAYLKNSPRGLTLINKYNKYNKYIKYNENTNKHTISSERSSTNDLRNNIDIDNDNDNDIEILFIICDIVKGSSKAKNDNSRNLLYYEIHC